jgi:hypothetical protein
MLFPNDFSTRRIKTNGALEKALEKVSEGFTIDQFGCF